MEKWEKEVHPEVKENLYQSSLSLDIQTVFNELGQSARGSLAPGKRDHYLLGWRYGLLW